MTTSNSVRNVILSVLPLVFVENSHGIGVYLSAPGSSNMNSNYSGTTVETFNSLTVGTQTTGFTSPGIGTWNISSPSNLAIRANDIYGAGPTQGNYAAFGSWTGNTGPIELNLTVGAEYLGFAWTAGDGANGVELYNGSTLLGSFSASSLGPLLSTPTITAVDGITNYTSSDYYWEPLNSGEPYAFINFVSSPGTSFNRILFTNYGGPTGFEFDNVTIKATAPLVDQQSVFVATIPEPSTVGLFALAGAGVLVRRRRKSFVQL